MRELQCDQDRAQAAADGWDMSNVHLGCEPGVALPVLARDVKPQYTPEAMRARVQGVVTITALVDTDGVVRDAKVTRSLDTVFGLDEEALKAVRATKFAPGEMNGRPVKTLVTLDLQFVLR